ncbi:MAG: hypothetical protein NC314_01585 [Roseburia sp.]|nr:hypothetical protein [Roseburia sp.]MCM1241506.1 hypothetical protein [Roseburia sp.]
MKIRCVWEHNGNDSILYSDNFIGAFTRGESTDIAMRKMSREVTSYLNWTKDLMPDSFEVEIVQEKKSQLNICDADSDVLFEEEKKPLTAAEYETLKSLALRSASDFLRLYESIPDKNVGGPARETFYGPVPRTAYEMYEHTKNVNSYYFDEIGVDIDNEGNILDCRKRGFDLLETKEDFLNNTVYLGSYDEEWSLRKVLRRFIWHDRIHAKAMYRMALKQFGADAVPNVFQFDI